MREGKEGKGTQPGGSEFANMVATENKAFSLKFRNEHEFAPLCGLCPHQHLLGSEQAQVESPCPPTLLSPDTSLVIDTPTCHTHPPGYPCSLDLLQGPATILF